VKLGARGCAAFPGAIPERLEQAPVQEGFAVEVLNSLGGGDAFMAGLLRGWLRDEPLERCCRYANACGAIVVSRHGCAPAMPTDVELQEFLRNPVVSALDHLHHATTRRPRAAPLHILAFDHRAQLEAIAQSTGSPPQRIAQFKSLVAEAFVRVAAGRRGMGVILDDRYGGAILPRLTAKGFWVARPVEVPGSIPVEFEAGAGLASALRTWPSEHIAKCLAIFGHADPEPLQRAQIERMRALAQACAATGREMLLEVISPARDAADASAAALGLDAIYAEGIKPDWWKLPPSEDPQAWSAIGETIERHDPVCRGVLVLGMEAPAETLRESFAAAARCRHVRGFAVGRSIFAPAADAWLAGRWSDARAVDDIAARYEEVIALWKSASMEREYA